MGKTQDDFVDGLIDAAVDGHRATVDVVRESIDRLHLLDNRLALLIQDSTIGDVTRDYARRNRAERLIEEVRPQITAAIEDIAAAATTNLLDVAHQAQDSFVEGFRKLFTVQVDVVTISDADLDDLVQGAMINGNTQGEWWDKLALEARKSFAMGVRNGVIQRATGRQLSDVVVGKRVVRATREVEDRIQTFHEHSGGVMDRVKNDAKAVVKTLGASVVELVRAELTRLNQKFFDGVQAIAVLDNRTSRLCRSRDHHAWDGEGGPIKSTGATYKFPGYTPWHLNCRTMIVPILKNYNQLKRIMPDLPSSYADTLDGAATRKQTYEQWLGKQSKARQLDILGPGQHALWSSGKLSLSDMLSFKGNPMTLKQLKAKVARNRRKGN